MRLFIAIELPKEVIAELARLQTELGMFGLRMVKEFHLTLKFLGDVPDSKIEKVKETLRAITFKPFTAELAETGVFPNPSYIRVVWAGVKGDTILQLQKDIELEFEKLGWGRDKDFKPHLTLARVNFVKDKAALADKLKALKARKIQFEVGEFKLIKSTLTPSGPAYETQEVFRSQ
jgi:RNA 2',3'-cyclic 3'-phosphodiesterase